MKPTEKKRDFIRLRAAGNSYTSIAKELHISKATCSAWEHELADEVARLKHDELEELYRQYGMVKTERIRQLGDTLSNVNEALASMDMSCVKPDVLLRMKLEYMAALKAEYAQGEAIELKNGSSGSILSAYIDLLHRVQTGMVDDAQAKTELAIIDKLRQAQNTADIDIFSFGGGTSDDEPEA